MPEKMPPIRPEVASFKVAGRSIQENLDHAVADGKIHIGEDGRYHLPPAPDRALLASDTPTLFKKGASTAPCRFLNHFMFSIAYGGAQVPHGCRTCFKVVVRLRDLRGLMALKQILDATPWTAKVRNEALDPTTPNTYVGVVYADGLDMAREMGRILRQSLDTDPALGTDIPISIRRGCSNYERACGPSDQYSFDAEQEMVERELAPLFAPPPDPLYGRAHREAAALLRLIQIAFQLGDPSYKDFTDGKGLSNTPATYNPDTTGGGSTVLGEI